MGMRCYPSLLALLGWLAVQCQAAPPLRLASFCVDATPPIGSPLCDGAVDPARQIVDPLSARGVVLLTNQKPIVLCVVDWVGIGNGGHDAWQHALAVAAGTTADRVAVHTVHQHDAPGCDFDAAALLARHRLQAQMFDAAFARATMQRAAAAVRSALAAPRTVTHIGHGQGKVEQVASSRRLLGPDGKVKYVRYSSCPDAAVRAWPEGTIDPFVRLVSFWDGDRPVLVLSYYATHPQSYYGQGGVSADFVGMARSLREQALPGILHVHFNGAAGNVAAGKYNDGAPRNRSILAARLAAGMKAAWESTRRVPIASTDVEWQTVPVVLPPSPRLEENRLTRLIGDRQAPRRQRLEAASDLAWLRRANAQRPIELAGLRLGPIRIVHMPGELFVEYQLAAQAMLPEQSVCMAAYGDYGPGYIGTQIAYSQGGYETGSPSRVAPSVEPVLLAGLRQLLK